MGRGLDGMAHVPGHRGELAALVALLRRGGVPGGLLQGHDVPLVHLQDLRGEIALVLLRPLQRLLGEPVVLGAEARLEAAEEQAIPRPQSHAALQRRVDVRLGLAVGGQAIAIIKATEVIVGRG